jgi:LPXTG-motif cell wall-anchored protein
VTGESDWLWWTLAIVVALVGAVALVVWRKGRPFAPGDVFRASRLSRGNRLFPTQVLITPTSVVQHTPRWIGRKQETIHMAHVASVKVDTGVLLSNVLIETSGGSDPIVCHGHRKADAVRMQALIERYQSEYYRGPGGAAPVAPTPNSR